MAPKSASGGTLTCARCLHQWIPRRDRPPARCPRCRSVKWQDPHLKSSCVRCGHSWYSHGGSPARCPSCGSYKWNVPLRHFQCQNCGHYWATKSERVPSRCPKCNVRDWHTVRDAPLSSQGESRSRPGARHGGLPQGTRLSSDMHGHRGALQHGQGADRRGRHSDQVVNGCVRWSSWTIRMIS